MGQIKDKIIWITGAGRGIGAKTATELAKTDATLVLSSTSPGAQYETMGYYPENFLDFDKVHYYPCNVSLPDSVKFVHSNIVKNVGEIDILINNAGVGKFDLFQNLTIEDYDNMMNVNARGTFACTKAVLDNMIEKKSGIIINILSAAVTKTFTYSSVYAASKAAILAMSRSLREEVREHGIKIVDILPGATETEIWDEQDRKDMGDKMLQTDDIAKTIISTIDLCLEDRIAIEEILIKPKYGDL